MPRGSSNVLSKEVALSTLPWALLAALGSALGLPRWDWQRAYDSSRRPFRGHNGAWDEKSTEGDDVNLVADGTTPDLG
jgi:hypothetical protein